MGEDTAKCSGTVTRFNSLKDAEPAVQYQNSASTTHRQALHGHRLPVASQRLQTSKYHSHSLRPYPLEWYPVNGTLWQYLCEMCAGLGCLFR